VIKKILIANRGEIACRIISTCKELGITAVSIYTKGEEFLPHVLNSDETYCLGSGELAETYLNIDKIILIGKQSHVDAIHPGYGFLSENSNFALALEKNDIKLIGPSANIMAIMGDKQSSKEEMEKINIPLIPGYYGDQQDHDFLLKESKKIGFPVLIKASAGGGGKGMRIVEIESEFMESLEGAKREALKSFGNDKVLIERYIQRPRHIEVQVLSDQHENHLHFFERECSIQRRYQKIIEETPSTALSEELRGNITQAAVKITESINYEGAGTIEFILDEDNKFYFLEMNTRLQVEHPVTEMTTGFDLVQLQIEVAEGKKLEIKQSEIFQQGHSIELRLYAEDPANNFLPSIGKLKTTGNIQSRGVRFDCGLNPGNEVTIDFDPMLAKLIVHAASRKDAIVKCLNALKEISFSGVKTNKDFLKEILQNPDFQNGVTYTSFISENKESLMVSKKKDNVDIADIIASFYLAQSGQNKNISFNTNGPWSNLSGFRNL
jgi:acetyl/propionyl-CoA carboxylase alpha subunit